jgi:hypothetical protein
MTDALVALQHLLTPNTVERLQAESARLQIPLNELVQEAVEEYLELLEETPEDTPDEKIIADFKQAWHEAMTGQTVPAREALAAIRKANREHGD